MKRPKTYEVNTHRLLVGYLSKMVAEINDINSVISPLRTEQEKEQIKMKAQVQAKAEKDAASEAKAKAAEAKVKAKETAFIEAKAVLARAAAKARTDESEAKELLEAKKLLGIKETENEV